MQNERIRIGVIVGPTASGKTGAAIEAAKILDAEIISADSIQIYEKLDIGSAKPSMEERQGIVHHMLDFVDPRRDDFSVASFKEKAEEIIRDIHERGKFPLIVGGTGLYINALTYPLKFDAVPRDDEVRKMRESKEEDSPGYCYDRLKEVDEDSAKRLHPNDKKRVIRALEVFEISGKTMTSYGADFANEAGQEPEFDARIAGLTMEREKLYERINLRVDIMLRDGLEGEVRKLYNDGYDVTLPALQGLSYRQFYDYFDGHEDYENTVERIKRETRRFAKRQITWFKRDKRIEWFNAEEYSDKKTLGESIARMMKGVKQ